MRHIRMILLMVVLLGVGAQAFASGEKVLVTGRAGQPAPYNWLYSELTWVDATGVLASETGQYIDATGMDTEAEIRDAFIAMIVDRAVNMKGYTGFTEKDILFFNYQTGTADQNASKGWLSAEIDGKTVGNTTVMTNTSGRDLVIDNVTIILTDIAGLGTAPILNVGKTGSSYNDIANTFGLSGLGTVGNMVRVTLQSSTPIVHNSESVVCRVATAAILTTTYKAKCLVSGRYLD